MRLERLFSASGSNCAYCSPSARRSASCCSGINEVVDFLLVAIGETVILQAANCVELGSEERRKRRTLKIDSTSRSGRNDSTLLPGCYLDTECILMEHCSHIPAFLVAIEGQTSAVVHAKWRYWIDLISVLSRTLIVRYPSIILRRT